MLVGLPENPKPGSEGATTWNPASVNGSITLSNSTIDPGHPCVSTKGVASGFEERWWMRMSSPSISVMKWSNRLSRASRARQS
ncbi:MAG: hypothetical protein R2710_23035 [Acidimicrobiales bacterium]